MNDPVQKPRQIPLDLPWPRRDRADRADFVVSESNADALGFVDSWRDWPDGRLALIGPEGSGKTHLALIWAKEAGAEFIDARALNDANVREAASLGHVIFEDCDRRVSGEDVENALFHLLNVLREQGGRLLMTARTPPSRWGIGLRDLASRLEATSVAPLREPDDDLLSQLVAKLFSDRDILVEERVAAYIALRIDRSFAAAQAAVARLDAASLEAARPISVPMVKEEFGW